MIIDVIIPLYNGSRWIKEAINSVFKQTYKVGKIIVIDDGSSDNSISIVRSIPNVLLVKGPGKGPAAARNTGLEYTKAAYIAFLDQDDIWHPDHLRMLSNVLIRYPNAGLVASNYKSFNDGSQAFFDVSNQSIEKVDTWEVYPNIWIPCSPSFCLFEKKEFAKIKWSVEHGGLYDYSLWMKTSISKPIYRIQAKSVAFRRHSDSHFETLCKNPKEYLELWARVADELLVYYNRHEPSLNKRQLAYKRNMVVHLLNNIINSITADTGDNLDKCYVMQLNHILEQESAKYQELCIQELMYFTSVSCSNKSEKLIIAYNKLLENWPNHSRSVKYKLMKYIVLDRPGLIFYRNYYLRRPWHSNRLVLFLLGIRNKFFGIRV